MGVRRIAALVSSTALLAACGGNSSGGAPTPANSRSAGSAPTKPVVTMSISDQATLTHAVPWQVMVVPVGDDVAESVDFDIDGKTLWQEQSSPYFFDDDHQLLAPWLLGNGKHVLTAHVQTVGGAAADAVAHVTVKVNLAANKAIAGRYERVVTKADQRRVTAYRVATKGAFGEVSPAGKWTISIKPNGEIFGIDPRGKSDGTFVEPFTLRGSSMRLYGAAVWRQPHLDQTGANKFCEPEAASDYTWHLSGTALTIRNVQRACADRDIVFDGTWQRVGS
jgi:hypothetical protein